MTSQIAMIILQIVIIILSTYLIYFVIEKAKNQAKITDIDRITKIVEDVKQKYTTEHEFLKTSLDLLANKQNILFSESKDNLIELFSNLNRWMWHCLNFKVNEYNQTNYMELQDGLFRINDYYNDVNISFGKTQLLINDDNIVKAGHETIMEVLLLHQYVESTLKNLKFTLADEKSMSDLLFSKGLKFDTLPQEMKGYYQNRALENSTKMKIISDEYHTKTSHLATKAMTKRNLFRDLARSYLIK